MRCLSCLLTELIDPSISDEAILVHLGPQKTKKDITIIYFKCLHTYLKNDYVNYVHKG